MTQTTNGRPRLKPRAKPVIDTLWITVCERKWANHWSDAELADALGLSGRQVSYLNSGERRVTVSILGAIIHVWPDLRDAALDYCTQRFKEGS